MTILFSDRCAWRAVYIHRGTASKIGAQVLHLGIDPDISRPRLFFALGLAPRTLGRLGSLLNPRFNVTCPHVSWSLAARSPLAMRVYRVQQRILHGLDGRYGWGTDARKAVR